MSFSRPAVRRTAALALLAPLAFGYRLAHAQPAALATDALPDAEAPTLPPTIDTDGDGKADAWDRNGDGRPDAWDQDGDGKPDAFDNDGDGKPD